MGAVLPGPGRRELAGRLARSLITAPIRNVFHLWPLHTVLRESISQLLGAGWSSPVARQAHNLKVVGSNPTPATNILRVFKRLSAALRGGVCVSNTRGSTVEARGAEVLRATLDNMRSSSMGFLSRLLDVILLLRLLHGDASGQRTTTHETISSTRGVN